MQSNINARVESGSKSLHSSLKVAASLYHTKGTHQISFKSVHTFWVILTDIHTYRTYCVLTYIYSQRCKHSLLTIVKDLLYQSQRVIFHKMSTSNIRIFIHYYHRGGVTLSQVHPLTFRFLLISHCFRWAAPSNHLPISFSELWRCWPQWYNHSTVLLSSYLRHGSKSRQSSCPIICPSSRKPFHSIPTSKIFLFHVSLSSAPSTPSWPPQFPPASPGCPEFTNLPSTGSLVSGRGGGAVGVWPSLCQGPSQRGGTARSQPHQ